MSQWLVSLETHIWSTKNLLPSITYSHHHTVNSKRRRIVVTGAAWECFWEHWSKGYLQWQISIMHLHALGMRIRCQPLVLPICLLALDHLTLPNHLHHKVNHFHLDIFLSLYPFDKFTFQFTPWILWAYQVHIVDGWTILLKDPMPDQPKIWTKITLKPIDLILSQKHSLPPNFSAITIARGRSHNKKP